MGVLFRSMGAGRMAGYRDRPRTEGSAYCYGRWGQHPPCVNRTVNRRNFDGRNGRSNEVERAGSARSRTRTDNPLREADFESAAYTDFAIRADGRKLTERTGGINRRRGGRAFQQLQRVHGAA